MKVAKPKIQVTESETKPLHFIDIYIPTVGHEEDPREVIVDHHEKYLHIFIPTEGKPTYKLRGEPTHTQHFHEMFSLFGMNYALIEFWDLCDKERT